MRSQLFSGAAVMAASLLVKDALAGPIGVRGVTVQVNEEVHVFKGLDGSLSTSIDYQTTTIGGGPAAPAPTSSAVAQQVNAKPQVAAVVNNPPAIVPVVTTSSLPAPKPTTTAQSSTPAATGTTSTASGNKVGLLYDSSAGVTTYANSNPAAASKFSWMYGWGSTLMTLPSSMSGVEQVPQLWGNDPVNDINPWAGHVANAKAAGSTHLMGPNEPDQCPKITGGSCIAYGDMQTLWKNQFLGQAAGATDYSKSFTLVSPSVTNGGESTKGVAYLNSFLADDTINNSVDIIGCHYYGSTSESKETATTNILAQVDACSKVGGKTRKVWLTEFQYVGPDAEAAFLAYAMPLLNSHSTLERYSYNMLAKGTVGSIGSAVAGLTQ